MKARELAEKLLETPDAEVTAWDPDSDRRQPVSGMVLRPEQGIVELHADIEP